MNKLIIPGHHPTFIENGKKVTPEKQAGAGHKESRHLSPSPVRASE